MTDVPYNPRIVWIGSCSWKCEECGETWERALPTYGHNCTEGDSKDEHKD
jgi:hypothetical protein